MPGPISTHCKRVSKSQRRRTSSYPALSFGVSKTGLAATLDGSNPIGEPFSRRDGFMQPQGPGQAKFFEDRPIRVRHPLLSERSTATSTRPGCGSLTDRTTTGWSPRSERRSKPLRFAARTRGRPFAGTSAATRPGRARPPVQRFLRSIRSGRGRGERPEGTRTVATTPGEPKEIEASCRAPHREPASVPQLGDEQRDHRERTAGRRTRAAPGRGRADREVPPDWKQSRSCRTTGSASRDPRYRAG